MSNLESAIRKALEKAGPGADAAHRARVYQSARNALENSFRKQDVADPAVISEQRRLLEAAIHRVERDMRLEFVAHQVATEQAEREEELRLQAEYDAADRARAAEAEARRAAAAPPDILPEVDIPEPAVRASAPVMAAPAIEATEVVDEPVSATSPLPSMDFVPEHVGSAALPRDEDAEVYTPEIAVEPTPVQAVPPRAARIDLPPERAAKPRRVRRWKAKAFAVVTIAAFVAASWWWVQSAGLLQPASERDGSVPNPPPSVQDQDFDGAKQLKSLSRQGGYGDEWKVVYDAERPGDTVIGPAAKATLKNGGSGPYLDIESTTTGDDGAVTIAIPKDVIAALQGKTSSVAVTLQGDGKPSQVAIECDFAGLGNCGRHRFVLSDNKSELLFQVDLKADGAASGDGKLMVNADAGGEANTARLYAIHILPGG